MSDPDSQLTFDYDGANRLVSASTVNAPDQPEVTLTYQYDKNGNRVELTSSRTGITHYTYDALNQVQTITSPTKETITFAYDALGRRTQTSRPNGVVTTFLYDPASQLIELTHQRGERILSRFQYGYNQVGNRMDVRLLRRRVQVETDLHYEYDELDRLISAKHPLSDHSEETFVYDAVGNRLREDGQTQNARFDAANQLQRDEDFRYTYDQNGNLLRKTAKATGATTLYTYNVENQLTRIGFPDGGLAVYRYDGLGRRIEKNVNGDVMRYIYDTEDILLEFDGRERLGVQYTHGLDVDEPLIRARDLNENGAFEQDEHFFYQTDALGSTTELTNSSGRIATGYVYDAFGQLVQQVGSSLNPYTYTGREFDPESGLYYYRARYYNPEIGRFLQEDPIQGVLTQPSTLNLYVYVRNNPVTFIDPQGLQLIQLGAFLSQRMGEAVRPGFGAMLAGAGAMLAALKELAISMELPTAGALVGEAAFAANPFNINVPPNDPRQSGGRDAGVPGGVNSSAENTGGPPQLSPVPTVSNCGGGNEGFTF